MKKSIVSSPHTDYSTIRLELPLTARNFTAFGTKVAVAGVGSLLMPLRPEAFVRESQTLAKEDYDATNTVCSSDERGAGCWSARMDGNNY
jgi:hypothetical protein